MAANQLADWVVAHTPAQIPARIPAAIPQARAWLTALRASALSHRSLTWTEPTSDTGWHGEVEFAWSSTARDLSVFFTGSAVYYVRCWGPSTHPTLVDGRCDSPERALALFRWFATGVDP